MKPNTTAQKRLYNSRGVALITALLLLSLFMVMTLAMVIATTSDTLINGYYRNFRGAFYASDSGLNSTRQYLQTQIAALPVPSTYVASNTTAPPSPLGYSTNYSTIMTNLTDATHGFGAFKSIDGTQTSWPGNFKVDSTNTWITTAGITSTANTVGAVTTYTFAYPYKITVIGKSSGNEQNTVQEEGVFTVPVVVTTAVSGGKKSNFAAWGTFFNTYPICGSPFVTGTMSGPFFSNDSWNFGDTGEVGNGSYIFTGSVGAANANVGYMYSDGTCHQSSATSDSESVTTSQTTTTGSGKNKKTVTTYTTTTTTIAPQFQGGLQTGQGTIPLPADTIGQEQAVLDGYGNCSPAGVSQTCSTPSASAMSTGLRSVTGSAYPSTAPSTGVFAPYTTTAGATLPNGSTCTTPPCFGGGGIYVQGNADSVTLAASTSGSGASTHTLQVITIKQGSTTTTVTLDLTGNKTTIADNSGHTTGAINGLPMNNNTSTEAAMVYVNGAISGTSSGTTTGLSGPSSGAAIPDGSAVTVTATGNIAITGNILYAREPVTLTQSGSTPADTLVTSPSTPSNVLGIYTSGGDIQIQPTSNVSTMEIDASLAMISNGGSGGLIAQWNSIGTLTIVGGRIANNAKSGASLGSRNIWFDQRFGSGGFAPPWFPSTTVGLATTTTSSAVMGSTTFTRKYWLNTTAQ